MAAYTAFVSTWPVTSESGGGGPIIRAISDTRELAKFKALEPRCPVLFKLAEMPYVFKHDQREARLSTALVLYTNDTVQQAHCSCVPEMSADKQQRLD